MQDITPENGAKREKKRCQEQFAYGLRKLMEQSRWDALYESPLLLTQFLSATRSPRPDPPHGVDCLKTQAFPIHPLAPCAMPS